MDEIMSSAPLAGSLTLLDMLIVGAAVAGLFVIAFIVGRKEKNLDDFFLGSRKIPFLVAALAFVATEVSAVTIVIVPGQGMKNLQYLQFFIGSAAAKVLVAFLFLPVFFKHNCTSIYQYLRERFGPASQYAGSLFFFVTRMLGSGVRLTATCIAVSIILGWTFWQALLLFTVVSIVFIGVGGVKAVVWTGAYQSIVFYGAGLAVAIWGLCQIPGGVGHFWQTAHDAGRLSVFNFNWDLSAQTGFWVGMSSAFFVGLAVFGTDQEMVQRLLTVETRRGSQKAILATIVAALAIVLLYSLLGTVMFVFFQQFPQTMADINRFNSGVGANDVFPAFIAVAVPMGLKGLMLSAILLASIDSPLSSLSSSFVMDIYRPLMAKNRSQRHYLWVSRAAIAGFGLVLAGLATLCRGVDNLLWFAFQIISVTGGALLGVFLLGILTKYGNNRGNIAAMLISSLAMVVMLFLCNYGPVGLQNFFGLTSMPAPADEPKIIPLAWGWSIVIGTLLTFALGMILGGRTRQAPSEERELVETEAIAK